MCNAFCDSSIHYILDCTSDVEAALKLVGNSILEVTNNARTFPVVREHGCVVGDVLEMVSCEPAPEAEFGEWHNGCTLDSHSLVLTGFRKIVGRAAEDGNEGDFVLVVL